MAEFNNQAQLSYQNARINSNIVTGEILETLSATKTASTSEYGQNTDVTYIISIVNAGGTPRTGLVVTDDLGAYPFGTGTLQPLDYTEGSLQYYQNGVLQPAPVITSTSPLTVSGISVPANGNSMLVYSGRTNGYAPLGEGASISNTATIGEAGDTDPIRVEERVPAGSGVNLTIAKSVVPVTVDENGTLTYSFVILNTGGEPAQAADLVTVSDTFSPILRDLSVTFDGAVWSPDTQHNYDDATGQFSTVPGQITVPAASYAQDPDTGLWQTIPGSATLLVSGTI